MYGNASFCSLFVVFTDAIRVVSTTSPALILTVLIALASCDRAKTKQAQTQPNKSASFRDTIFDSVTPTADGGAYAISSDSGLWYLRDSKAVKVKFPNLPTPFPDSTAASAARTFSVGTIFD